MRHLGSLTRHNQRRVRPLQRRYLSSINHLCFSPRIELCDRSWLAIDMANQALLDHEASQMRGVWDW